MVCIIENLRVHGPACLGVRVVPLKILQLLFKLLDFCLGKCRNVDVVGAGHERDGFLCFNVNGMGTRYKGPFARGGALCDEVAFFHAVGADLLAFGWTLGLTMSFLSTVVATSGADSIYVHSIRVSGGGSMELWRWG